MKYNINLLSLKSGVLRPLVRPYPRWKKKIETEVDGTKEYEWDLRSFGQRTHVT
jgi:hypothetical protein